MPRPRKKKSKIYFGSAAQEAIIEYNASNDPKERNKIYKERIQYPFEKLAENTRYFREEMTKAGLEVRDGYHPIAPIMFYDEKLNAAIAKDLIEEENIYVIPFSFPVVPKNEARIRVQLSSSHTREHLDKAINAFVKIAKKHGALNVNLREKIEG